jgi:xanthine/uracil permease
VILRREAHWSVWWIVISNVGWTTGMALLPGLILTGVMVGAVTGIALELLLPYPKPADKKIEETSAVEWRNG